MTFYYVIFHASLHGIPRVFFPPQQTASVPIHRVCNHTLYTIAHHTQSHIIYIRLLNPFRLKLNPIFIYYLTGVLAEAPIGYPTHMEYPAPMTLAQLPPKLIIRRDNADLIIPHLVRGEVLIMIVYIDDSASNMKNTVYQYYRHIGTHTDAGTRITKVVFDKMMNKVSWVHNVSKIPGCDNIIVLKMDAHPSPTQGINLVLDLLLNIADDDKNTPADIQQLKAEREKLTADVSKLNDTIKNLTAEKEQLADTVKRLDTDNKKLFDEKYKPKEQDTKLTNQLALYKDVVMLHKDFVGELITRDNNLTTALNKFMREREALRANVKALTEERDKLIEEKNKPSEKKDKLIEEKDKLIEEKEQLALENKNLKDKHAWLQTEFTKNVVPGPHNDAMSSHDIKK